jgi:hypothetical protein
MAARAATPTIAMPMMVTLGVLAAPWLVGCDDSSTPLESQQERYGWGSGACPAPPQGTAVGFTAGDYLQAVPLKDCDGSDVSFDELCGAQALWVSFAHAWCPHCNAVAEMAEDVHDGFAGRELASVNVLMEWNPDEEPNADHCQRWRDAFGLEDVIVWYDPEGVSLQYFELPYTALNLYIDSTRIIREKEHTDQQSRITADIEAALSGAGSL